MSVFQRPRHHGQLVFAVAAHDERTIAGGNQLGLRRGLLIGERKIGFLEAGQQLLQPIEQACGNRGSRGNDIHTFEERQPGEQIEIGGPEAGRVHRAIADGDDEMAERACGCRQQKLRAERVFVHAAGCAKARFVTAKRSSQKYGLSKETLGATVDGGVFFKIA